MIKPSFPTPPLRIHKLSLLDQISPPVFIPLIFFYQHDHQKFHGKLESLKQSLSDALARFYPLAGRLDDNKYSIDCNDAGAQFIVAQVHGSNLSQVIQTPKMEQLREFLPRVGGNHDDDDVLVAVQVNLFDSDKGIAIGVCMSHKVGDGSSIVTFMNAWATIARDHRGDAEIMQPNFNLASTLFPPIDLSNSSFKPSVGMKKKEKVFTTRRFVFDKEKLDALKKSASSRSLVKDPTRVEALSAFLWNEALKLNKDCNKKKFAAVHAVNIRSRMNNPAIPDYFFGNLWTAALAFSESSSNTDDHDLLYKLRNAIRKIDSDYVKMLQKGQDFMKNMGKLVELFSTGEVEFCNFTSWCRFPVYEVDFGWGKPVWVCTTTFPYENMIIFLSTKCGEGIEAWVNMPVDDDFIGNSPSILAK